ncbi:MAG: UPF0149 family protein [Gammaproteobacteria bacterium]|nr:UPF0149 family protein [Gammaproteobacteria bacterium]
MTSDISHDQLNDALRGTGSSWDAAQTHGLVSGKLAVLGAAAGPAWLEQVLEGTDASSALRKECEDMLSTLYQSTHRQLAERLSEFAPLLPGDHDSKNARTEALAHWCEGYLHGLVSAPHDDPLKQRLAAEPVAGIIKDMLSITQVAIDDHGTDSGDDDNDEQAYVEIVEYLRVAAQLVYEELAEQRPQIVQ